MIGWFREIFLFWRHFDFCSIRTRPCRLGRVPLSPLSNATKNGKIEIDEKLTQANVKNLFEKKTVKIAFVIFSIELLLLSKQTFREFREKFWFHPWPGLFLQKIKQKKVMKSNFYSLPIFFSARNCSIVGYLQIFGGINQIQWSPAIFSIPPFITFGPWKQTIFIEQWSKTAKSSR